MIFYNKYKIYLNIFTGNYFIANKLLTLFILRLNMLYEIDVV